MNLPGISALAHAGDIIDAPNPVARTGQNLYPPSGRVNNDRAQIIGGRQSIRFLG
jgi:hypothetical protein